MHGGLLDSNRFSQVPGTVDIAASLDCQVVREQLHWDDGQDSLQSVNSSGNLQRVFRPLAGLSVALLHDDDRFPVSGSHLDRQDWIRSEQR